VLHTPQLFESLWTSTHDWPHGLSPAGQRHMLLWHDAPMGHCVPHFPQLAKSVVMSTHVGPHICCVVSGHAHVPF
jgi:hypothetical protein